ncbi:MAG: hypothetical protein ACLURX_05095 [Clostridia bacterium]
MFRDKLNKIIGTKDSKTDGKDGRKIENLVVFAIILIITIIVINVIWNGDEKKSTKDTTKDYSKKLASNTTTEETSEACESSDLEKKLENILSKIQGVGKVKVFINYSQSSETVAMYNENSKVSQTEETDTSGGKRVIESTDSQKDIVFKEENGEKIPITQKIIQPKIEGAIITAQGANDATTKSNIMQAVEAATGIATHKIQVFEMN